MSWSNALAACAADPSLARWFPTPSVVPNPDVGVESGYAANRLQLLELGPGAASHATSTADAGLLKRWASEVGALDLGGARVVLGCY